MGATAEGTSKVTSWDEQPYEELADGVKLTRAEVVLQLDGDIDGEAAVQWLMAYRADGTAHYTGLQRVTGTLGGREGSFVVETIGEFDGEVAAGSWTVIDGWGSGQLSGLRGSGTFRAPMAGTATWTLEHSFDDGET